MTSRRGEGPNNGADGPSADPKSLDAERADVHRPEVIPSTALTLTRPTRLVNETALSSSDRRLPLGMATTEQFHAFRELRTQLLAMAASLNRTHFTTLVVPVSPGSGASFVTRNLAAAFTLQDRRVAILVDCNLRHPTQHLSFGMRAERGGLFDYLEQPHASIEELVRPTRIPGLHLIPAGRPPAMPREYFSSETMRGIMTALHESPCYVFLDGPAAKGSPDARILSDLADIVVLVAGYGIDTNDGIAQTAALFDPKKFAGVVFNERH